MMLIKYPFLNFKDAPLFKPNVSPAMIINLGAFGGTYFRPIYCPLNKKSYNNEHKEFDMFKNISEKKICSTTYDEKINYYGKKCGCSLEYWHEKKWIHMQDPYGWFQWYCRFYNGRRSSDDERQIKRFLRQTSRFNSGKRERTNKEKQVLLHWGKFVGACTKSCKHSEEYVCI